MTSSVAPHGPKTTTAQIQIYIADVDAFPGAERVLATADLKRLDPELAPYVIVATQGVWDEEATAAALALGDALAIAVLTRRGLGPDDMARLHPGGAIGRGLVRVVELMHRGDEVPVVRESAPLEAVIRAMSATTSGAPILSSQAAPTTSAGCATICCSIHVPSMPVVDTGAKRPSACSRTKNPSTPSANAPRIAATGQKKKGPVTGPSSRSL